MTKQSESDFDDIPGTIVFDSRRARLGLSLNKMCGSLTSQENRDAFVADPNAYMVKFRLSEEQKSAVVNRDWMRMLELGGNIYFVAKIGLIDGLTVQEMNAQMTGVSAEEFVEMMKQGGRNPNG